METQTFIDLMASDDEDFFDKAKAFYLDGKRMGKIESCRRCLHYASLVSSNRESLGDDAGFKAAEEIADAIRLTLEGLNKK
jgi:hypothetical protein